ncbi:PIR protein [Plasmodium vivax]|uniref:VIR protein n=1 Tax=Plasmodium vivax TaxID=5855 RepID=A0A565A6I6_PLAVI|nr:PIR protein [Plasmodium vivax]
MALTLLTNSPKGEQIQTFKDFSGRELLLEAQGRALEISPSKRHEGSQGHIFRDTTRFTPKPLRHDQESLEYPEEKTEGGMHQPDYRGSNAAPKEGGVSGILSSISGVLGDVDPVPVVGVSGGMGALFLLFRYTPIGAFFRGGRGRVHRIPRSFNGPFPGGFPGYEEYDVGHIGYGPMNPLAE